MPSHAPAHQAPQPLRVLRPACRLGCCRSRCRSIQRSCNPLPLTLPLLFALGKHAILCSGQQRGASKQTVRCLRVGHIVVQLPLQPSMHPGQWLMLLGAPLEVGPGDAHTPNTGKHTHPPSTSAACSRLSSPSTSRAEPAAPPGTASSSCCTCHALPAAGRPACDAARCRARSPCGSSCGGPRSAAEEPKSSEKRSTAWLPFAPAAPRATGARPSTGRRRPQAAAAACCGSAGSCNCCCCCCAGGTRPAGKGDGDRDGRPTGAPSCCGGGWAAGWLAGAAAAGSSSISKS